MQREDMYGSQAIATMATMLGWLRMRCRLLIPFPGSRVPHVSCQMQERRFGPFERRITLPEEVEEDSLEARFDRGVLIITARMKSAEGEPRQIKIVGAGN